MALTAPRMKAKEATIRRTIVKWDITFSFAENDRDNWRDAAGQADSPCQL
jgi:hypothetical protein